LKKEPHERITAKQAL